MKQDELYVLIQRMTKQEKIFFNRFAKLTNSRKDKHYISLFKTIEKQLKTKGEVNEAKLKNQFQYLSVEKRYLMNILIKALTAFREKEDGFFIVKTLMKQIRVLIDKQIYNEAKKLHGKAVVIADKYDLYEDLLILNNLRMVLGDSHKQFNDFNKIKACLLDKEKRVAEMQNYDEYRFFIYQIRAWINENGYIDDDEKVENFATLIDQPLVQDANYPLSGKANELYFNARVFIFELLYDLNQKYQEFQKRIAFMRANKHLYTPLNQIIFTHNYIFCCIGIRAIDECQYELNYLNTLVEEYPIKSGVIMAFTYMRHLDFYSQVGAFEKNREWISIVEKGLKTYQHFEPIQEESIYFGLGRAYLELGCYEQALDYLYKVGQYKIFHKTSVTYAASKLLILICYYELNWHSNLESALIAFYRQIRRVAVKYKVYESLLKYLKLGIANKDLTNKKTIHFFYSEWDSIEPYSRESIPFQFFHYREWLKSKIEKKTLSSYFLPLK